jgi:inner membrane protein
MASVGHIIVGMTAARVAEAPATPGRRWARGALFWSLLSLLPDLDVVGFSLGVQYGDEWGHRGATHSLVFSLTLGVAIGLLAPWFRRPVVRTGGIATAVLISHALLDTLTDGGLGCALLWPFDDSRYFAPWNPIPVAPIGLSFLTPYGLFVSVIELALFGPLLWFALTPSRALASSSIPRGRWGGRRSRTLLLVGWVVVVWLIASRDPLRESVVALAVGDDTVYAPGFSGARPSRRETRARTTGGPCSPRPAVAGVPAVHAEAKDRMLRRAARSESRRLRG